MLFLSVQVALTPSPLLASVAVAPNGAYVDGDRLRPMKAECAHSLLPGS